MGEARELSRDALLHPVFPLLPAAFCLLPFSLLLLPTGFRLLAPGFYSAASPPSLLPPLANFAMAVLWCGILAVVLRLPIDRFVDCFNKQDLDEATRLAALVPEASAPFSGVEIRALRSAD